MKFIKTKNFVLEFNRSQYFFLKKKHFKILGIEFHIILMYNNKRRGYFFDGTTSYTTFII